MSTSISKSKTRSNEGVANRMQIAAAVVAVQVDRTRTLCHHQTNFRQGLY